MTAIDYGARAELFTGGRGYALRPVRYQRFASASEAIKFAVEEVEPEHFLGTYLQVEDDRFDRHEIGRLYNSVDFPLARKKAASRRMNVVALPRHA